MASAPRRVARMQSKQHHLPWLASLTVLVLVVGFGGVAVVEMGTVSHQQHHHLSHPRGAQVLQEEDRNETDADEEGSKDDDDESAYPQVFFSRSDMRRGAVVLCLGGVLYMFAALAIVCDDFFVPSLEVITERLDLSEDVAGATFMAAGGSAPELFTSFIGVFVAKSNVGFGTIVGSAVFNILFVIGCCAALTYELDPRGLPLTWWPLFRDSCFYSVALVLLTFFFWDEEIAFYESLTLLFLYIAYVLFMKCNEKAKTSAWRLTGATWKELTDEMVRAEEMVEKGVGNNGAEEEKKGEEDDEDDEDDEPWRPSFPSSGAWHEKFLFVFFFPLRYVLWLTVPNCNIEEKKRYYILAFSMSIFWVAVFAYFMVWWAEVSSKTLGIPSEVMGFTVLAAGTSVPDLITSVIVAKKGFADMAVSSSIGSNIFDITFGLPLPWCLRSLVDAFKAVEVKSKSLGAMVVMLVIMLLTTIGAIALFGWRLNVALGGTSLVLYSIFVTFALLLEYDVISF